MEEIHYLIPEKLKIIQDSRFFKFGNDSVYLANFVQVKEGEKVVDLGSGSGVIPLLLAYKQSPGKVMGLEIQSQLVEMSRRSVKLNKLEDKIMIIQGDLKKADDYIAAGSIDLVISNPPYMPVNTGKITENRAKAIARHELEATLEDVIRAGATLLRYGGRMAMVHRAWRLAEIFSIMREYQLEPKRILLVQSRLQTEARTVLIEAKKGANPGLEIEPVLVVYRGDSDEYTPRVKEMYGEDLDV